MNPSSSRAVDHSRGRTPGGLVALAESAKPRFIADSQRGKAQRPAEFGTQPPPALRA